MTLPSLQPVHSAKWEPALNLEPKEEKQKVLMSVKLQTYGGFYYYTEIPSSKSDASTGISLNGELDGTRHRLCVPLNWTSGEKQTRGPIRKCTNIIFVLPTFVSQVRTGVQSLHWPTLARVLTRASYVRPGSSDPRSSFKLVFVTFSACREVMHVIKCQKQVKCDILLDLFLHVFAQTGDTSETSWLL